MTSSWKFLSSNPFLGESVYRGTHCKFYALPHLTEDERQEARDALSVGGNPFDYLHMALGRKAEVSFILKEEEEKLMAFCLVS